MLNNPTPVIYQNFNKAMEEMSKAEKPVEDKGGLLGPRKQMTKQPEDDILSPARRVASYVQEIRTKREEIKNG